MTRVLAILQLLSVFLFATIGFGANEKPSSYIDAHSIGTKAANYAMKKLQKPQKTNILVITTAGFVRANGMESSGALDSIAKITGATIGNGNLLSLHSAPERPLFFFFYNPSKGDGLYIEAGLSTRKKGELTIIYERYIPNFLSFAEQKDAFEKSVNEKLMRGNEFKLLMITSLWAKGIPMEMRNSILFHDHFCPGVTSGFYIAQFLRNDFPLNKDESYYIIASPPWCKDDALQTILNTTVGKRSMAVIPIPASDMKCLSEDAKKAAGIYFKHNKTTKTSKAIVLAFDWDKMRKDAGIQLPQDAQQKTPPSETIKLAGFMFDNLKKYKNYVSVIKEFSLTDGEMPEDYARLGVKLWQKVGLWNKECEN